MHEHRGKYRDRVDPGIGRKLCGYERQIVDELIAPAELHKDISTFKPMRV